MSELQGQSILTEGGLFTPPPAEFGAVPCDEDPLGEGWEPSYVQPLYANDGRTLLRAPSVTTSVLVDPDDDFPRYPNRWFRGYDTPLKNQTGDDTFYKKPYFTITFGKKVKITSVSYLGYYGYSHRYFKGVQVYADGLLVGNVTGRNYNDFIQWTRIELYPVYCTELKFALSINDRAGITSLKLEGVYKP